MSAAKIPQKWDYEADVIIVGGGTCGLPAAIKVAEAGQKAVVLESRPACGGSLGMIAGGVAFAGTDEQKEAGIEDSPDILCQNMIDASGSDPKLARAYADNQLEAYRMLKDQGVSWVGVNQVPGHNRCRGLRSVAEGRGPKLVKAFETRARDRGVEILFRHNAERLIIDRQTERIIGVQVSVNNERKYFKAKRAVIIASGGFGHNPEMVAEYAPSMVAGVPRMPMGHQGIGLKMALDVGAATKDIGRAVAGSWPICAETHSNAIWALDSGGIMVNVYGKRFYNEASVEGFYGFMTEAGHEAARGSLLGCILSEQY